MIDGPDRQTTRRRNTGYGNSGNGYENTGTGYGNSGNGYENTGTGTGFGNEWKLVHAKFREVHGREPYSFQELRDWWS